MPVTRDWANALWLQQHSESAFFGTPPVYLFLERAFSMHDVLFTKNEISSSIHFWNVDHNNGRKQNIVQKKAVKASKACRKKSSAFKRKTSPYQVRRDLLYYHRWTHLQKYFVITKIILLILWITLYSPVEPSTAQYIPVQSGTIQYCPVQPSTAQEVNWFSDTVDYSWLIEQL